MFSIDGFLAVMTAIICFITFTVTGCWIIQAIGNSVMFFVDGFTGERSIINEKVS